MTPEQKNRIREAFEFVRGLPSSVRDEWLDANCPDDTVRSEVRQLLQFDVEDSFLNRPALPGERGERIIDLVPSSLGSSTKHFGEVPSHDPLLKAPLIHGRYKLLQRIGEGGFGVVYMAEQTVGIRRRVAIKILKPGMDTRNIIARFETEQQALALWWLTSC